jgi:hypothetical protein
MEGQGTCLPLENVKNFGKLFTMIRKDLFKQNLKIKFNI